MAGLAVNVDHVATVRNARGGIEPDPVWAASQVQLSGANGVVVHLRGDRRHITDRDVKLIRQITQTKMILEMAATEEMLAIASEVKPDQATLVPETDEEITTLGGMDLGNMQSIVGQSVQALHQRNIKVSLFVDPDLDDMRLAKELGADVVELHTGVFCEAPTPDEQARAFDDIRKAARLAHSLGLEVHAGHGLGYLTLPWFFGMEEVAEFSIGHSIISRAIFTGLDRAVLEMLELVKKV